MDRDISKMRSQSFLKPKKKMKYNGSLVWNMIVVSIQVSSSKSKSELSWKRALDFNTHTLRCISI